MLNSNISISKEKTAKITAVFYAAFFTVFALLSGAENANGIKGVLLNLLNILPWLLVWLAVFIAWKKPKLGGVLFLSLAIASIVFFHTYKGFFPFILISLPLIIIGLLFLKKPVELRKKDQHN